MKILQHFVVSILFIVKTLSEIEQQILSFKHWPSPRTDIINSNIFQGRILTMRILLLAMLQSCHMLIFTCNMPVKITDYFCWH